MKWLLILVFFNSGAVTVTVHNKDECAMVAAVVRNEYPGTVKPWFTCIPYRDGEWPKSKREDW